MGRKFYTDVILQRIDPKLLDAGVLEYAIESTGKLTELVEVMKEASLNAFRSGQERIAEKDVAAALDKLRMTFDRTLTEAHKKKLLKINSCKEAREEDFDSALTRELLFSLTAVEYEMIRADGARSIPCSSPGGEMESVSLEDLEEVDLLLTWAEISRGRGNLILCSVASPAYRDKVIAAVAAHFSSRVLPVERETSSSPTCGMRGQRKKRFSSGRFLRGSAMIFWMRSTTFESFLRSACPTWSS